MDFRIFLALLLFFYAFFAFACWKYEESAKSQDKALNSLPVAPALTPVEIPTPEASRTPNLQAEILSDENKSSGFPIANFDFKNFKYPLPRGWQDFDSKEAELVDGKRPIFMESDNKRERKIGLSYLTTKFFDVTGDEEDEAIVILQVETGGASIPHLVYIFTWEKDAPKLLWYFRTGDRADGGLKNIYSQDGKLVIELYGQDRYVVGEVETARIMNDEEQICCPTHFTKSYYKWNGKYFALQGKRLTFSLIDKDAKPIENMIELVEKQNRARK
ncbi:MAG: hypothetical protein D6687_06180 [Acidobacteria bacterium]|jgi:hypothetical protein|nr:MAG: hypothetical protein D6687_06180 [Acidobacteriota bacterium]GIU82614.1 MAG: hypothetical protein KatS3mg006_1678 [Pyrinomonadaceae bacterium]